MKIFTAAQIKDRDAFTIQEQNISSTQLMERAALQCYHWIASKYTLETSFLLLCGMGNNGGDGLALTRLLLKEGFSAKAVVLKHALKFTADASQHFTLLHEYAPENLQILEPGLFVTDVPQNIIIIDALFGSGLNRPLEDWPAAFIREINELKHEKIAIDLPSGLPCDSLPAHDSAVMHVHHTLSFQHYKRSMLHQESEQFCGKIHLLNIGLSSAFNEHTHTQYHAIDVEVVKHLYKKRDPFGHKGTYGSVQLIGGSYGKIGSIALSTKAALRTGAGLVFTQAPTCGYEILQTTNPEAMFIKGGTNYMDQMEANHKVVIGIGPGLGQEEETQKALFKFLQEYDKPVVLDADAINLLAQQEDQLLWLHADSILTPHPKEFERLFGASKDSMFQVEIGRAKAMKYNINIILKGHHTAVLTPTGECYYNTTGNAGMATGGSGDVLTGIITSLLAQGYSSKEACILGVYLHGLAGDLAADHLSQEAMIAGDIIDYLGKAFLRLTEM